MSTYLLLQRGGSLGRFVISDEPLPGYETVSTCEAESWAAAKAEFGFALTRQQQDKLEFGQ